MRIKNLKEQLKDFNDEDEIRVVALDVSKLGLEVNDFSGKDNLIPLPRFWGSEDD